MTKIKIQNPNESSNPKYKQLNDLDLSDSFGFWALDFGFMETT